MSERGGVKLRGYRVSFRDVPMQCSRGSAQTFDLGASKLLYRRKTRRFAPTAVTLGTGGETQGYWAYEGRLVRNNLARGTIKVRDRAFAVGQGQPMIAAAGSCAGPPRVRKRTAKHRLGYSRAAPPRPSEATEQRRCAFGRRALHLVPTPLGAEGRPGAVG